MVSTICRNRIVPSWKASTRYSFAALSTAGAQPPAVPARRARSMSWTPLVWTTRAENKYVTRPHDPPEPTPVPLDLLDRRYPLQLRVFDDDLLLKCAVLRDVDIFVDRRRDKKAAVFTIIAGKIRAAATEGRPQERVRGGEPRQVVDDAGDEDVGPIKVRQTVLGGEISPVLDLRIGG